MVMDGPAARSLGLTYQLERPIFVHKNLYCDTILFLLKKHPTNPTFLAKKMLGECYGVFVLSLAYYDKPQYS